MDSKKLPPRGSWQGAALTDEERYAEPVRRNRGRIRITFRWKPKKPSPAGEGTRRSGGMWRGHLQKVPERVRKNGYHMGFELECLFQHGNLARCPLHIRPAGHLLQLEKAWGFHFLGIRIRPGFLIPSVSTAPHQSGLCPASFPGGEAFAARHNAPTVHEMFIHAIVVQAGRQGLTTPGQKTTI